MPCEVQWTSQGRPHLAIKSGRGRVKDSSAGARNTSSETPAPEIVDEFAGVPPEELPFSAGVPLDRAAIVKVLELDDVFVETCKMRNRFRRVHKLRKENVLLEFACSNDSVIGHVAQSINVSCIRLSRDVLDLTNPEHLAQALGQADALPGSDTWVSICVYIS